MSARSKLAPEAIPMLQEVQELWHKVDGAKDTLSNVGERLKHLREHASDTAAPDHHQVEERCEKALGKIRETQQALRDLANEVQRILPGQQ